MCDPSHETRRLIAITYEGQKTCGPLFLPFFEPFSLAEPSSIRTHNSSSTKASFSSSFILQGRRRSVYSKQTNKQTNRQTNKSNLVSTQSGYGPKIELGFEQIAIAQISIACLNAQNGLALH